MRKFTTEASIVDEIELVKEYYLLILLLSTTYNAMIDRIPKKKKILNKCFTHRLKIIDYLDALG